MSVITYLVSNVGPGPESRQEKNEDFAVAWEKNKILFQLVADGNGSSELYNPATFCANEIRRFIDLYLEDGMDEKEIKHMVNAAVYTANRVLLAYKKANNEMYTNNSFTTLTMAVILPDDRFLFVHCGNSRLYLVRNELIRQFTKDHTEAQRLCDEGKIKKEEVDVHPDKNILTSALGFETPRIDIMSGSLKKGDIVMLLTDGVYKTINLDQLHDIVFQTGNCKDACEGIVTVANSLDCQDNFSAIISYITE